MHLRIHLNTILHWNTVFNGDTLSRKYTKPILTYDQNGFCEPLRSGSVFELMSGLEAAASRDMDLHLKTPRVPHHLAILTLRKPPTLPFPFECSRTFYRRKKRFLVSSFRIDDQPFSTDLKFFSVGTKRMQ